MMKRYLFIFLVGGVVFTSCRHDIPLDVVGTVSPNCDPDSVYFGNTIFPIIASNCAKSGCHDHGELDLSNYAAIINSGFVKPGHPSLSKLVKVLTSTGDNAMPPSPNQALTQDQINSIRKWIEQGARYNTCVSCDTLNYKFAADIWPILNTNCTGCHNDNYAGGNVLIRNYADVQAMVSDGSFIGSLLGDGYSLMPKNTTGLQSCKITQIQKWINDGAQNN